jgi:selenide, water dikinase
MSFDLLTTVESGGCSAKFSASELEELLKYFPSQINEKLLVGTETQDDAGVYKLNEDTALIFTTDFFPPVCSDPYTFGQIAAANSLSDVYAMGGKPLLALNIMMFPNEKIPNEVYAEILKGGNDKVIEARAMIIGGHTINDFPPKYGLAVIGTVHPSRVITNAAARAGDMLILTKPLGTGIAIAGRKAGLETGDLYERALENMTQLNDKVADLMQKYDVKCATDITGYGLLGHAFKLAKGSNVSLRINGEKVPVMSGVYELADEGCLPGACFRNLKYIDEHSAFNDNFDYNLKMIFCDAQTSGGMLISVSADKAEKMLRELKVYYPYSELIGEVVDKSQYLIFID